MMSVENSSSKLSKKSDTSDISDMEDDDGIESKDLEQSADRNEEEEKDDAQKRRREARISSASEYELKLFAPA